MTGVQIFDKYSGKVDGITNWAAPRNGDKNGENYACSQNIYIDFEQSPIDKIKSR